MTSLSEHRSSEVQHVPPSSPDRAEQGARDSPAGMLLAHIVVQSQDTFFLFNIYLFTYLASLGLSCITEDLLLHQTLRLWHAGSRACGKTYF